ncbi:MAG: cation transporter [Candidatus Omnitrophica bacterium]|nr:cation transporter [Candidatus Omnitrophota bacterium]
MEENLALDKLSAERRERYRKISDVLWIVLFLNFSVAAGKIILGWATNCLSVLADGVHSFSDGASNIIGLFGIHLSRQPKDFDHPYGHRRYETLASLAIAIILFFVSFHLFEEAYRLFKSSRTSPGAPPLSFAVMLATMLVNIAVALYERKRAGELQSDLLRSDSMHTASDVLVSLSVIAGLVLIRAGWVWADSLTTMFVALVILRVALDIVKQSSDVLCDHIVLDAEEVRSLVTQVKGVKSCHMVRSRGRSDDAQVDLHVLVADHMDVKTAHEISHLVEGRISKRYPGVSDVVVHIEPESTLEEGHI